EAHAALAAAREQAAAAETARSRLVAEAQALGEVLAVKDGERWPRMVDQLEVPAGLEPALGAALGEELESGCDAQAARHWRGLPPLAAPAALPPGARSLAGLVSAPPALARALAATGLVEDEAAGDAAQTLLAPGQVLVSAAGAMWRWDGYAVRAGTPTPAAVRLQQRNRFLALRARLGEATAEAERTRDARGLRHARASEADAADARGRAARRDAEARLERARAAAASLAAQAATAEGRFAPLVEQHDRIAADAADAAATCAAARDAVAALPDPAASREATEHTRATLAAARQREAAARAALDALRRHAAERAARRGTVAAELADWHSRRDGAAGRVVELAERAAEATADAASLADAPARAAALRGEAADALAVREAEHGRTADALVRAEAQARDADRQARAAEGVLAACREAAIRAEGESTQAEAAWAAVAERIVERLGPHPALPDPPADRGAEAEAKAKRRLERLQREREEMGPVNLRAELEAEQIAGQVEAIARERQDLATAIAKLRGSIGHINREGRERLADVFTTVDGHFQALFGRMFNGGRAHLALVGSDDPLEAGLEIYAQPPGKKLATLSLLSGGEQALTALSLIFAVFRSNPAPVCVLDEVDAPLDDANVERFCSLLDDMVRDTGTRFLVVTHHHLTMARMDRLYGVTMQERGVSRLLSVDLRRAAELADQPRMAAE
ncbi:MAG: chromosome segregation protein SMC, partial [Acidisphaera sp.]|nr:chromosome segregation protein SMC [Acidisphaera sp.]